MYSNNQYQQFEYFFGLNYRFHI